MPLASMESHIRLDVHRQGTNQKHREGMRSGPQSGQGFRYPRIKHESRRERTMNLVSSPDPVSDPFMSQTCCIENREGSRTLANLRENLRHEIRICDMKRPHKRPQVIDLIWLGREDSNLRMAESKSAALPLGYAPTGQAGYRESRGAAINSLRPGWGRAEAPGAAFFAVSRLSSLHWRRSW
jgi:hypothetical protein